MQQQGGFVMAMAALFLAGVALLGLLVSQGEPPLAASGPGTAAAFTIPLPTAPEVHSRYLASDTEKLPAGAPEARRDVSETSDAPATPPQEE
jgi:hypothetical protein